MKFNGQAELGFSLPELVADNRPDIPLTPKKLEKWLAQLPILNINQLAYQIPKYIQELNRVKLSDNNRFTMLEQLRPLVSHIYEALTKRVRGQNLNLSVESQEIQWLANVLVTEMAIGYKRLLFNRAVKKAGWLSRGQYVVLAQRVSYYLAERISLAYLLSSAVPDGVWKDLNATYAYSRKLRLHAKVLKDDIAYVQQIKGDIDCIYNQALLLTLVSPYSLRSAELEQVYYGLSPWLKDIKIINISEFNESHSDVYVIDFKKDKAPEYHPYMLDGDDKYIIDNERLVKKLNKWLDTGDAPESAQYKGMSKKLLIEIIANLSRTKQRSEERLYNPGEKVEIVIGLQNIDVFLGHIESLINKNTSSPIPMVQIDPQAEKTESMEDIEDDWDSLHFYAEKVEPKQRRMATSIEDEQQKQGPEVRRHSFNIENESKFGVCLSCSSLHGEGLFIGELMFIRGYDPEIWTLGIVRWMMVKNKKLEIGLYLLSAKVNQVSVSSDNAMGDISINALWLAEGEYGDTLLLPSAEFKTGEILQLEHDGKEMTASLGNIVWHSEGFSQFSFRVQGNQQENSEDVEEFLIPEWAQ